MALLSVLGFCAGLVFGMVAGSSMGNVDSDRVKRAVRRLRPGDEPDEDAVQIEHELIEALRTNPTTRDFNLGVRALGGGLVELTGIVPDEATRDLAGSLARNVLGADIVVNRVLVEGMDIPEPKAAE